MSINGTLFGASLAEIRIKKRFIQEITYENVCQLLAILFRSQCAEQKNRDDKMRTNETRGPLFTKETSSYWYRDSHYMYSVVYFLLVSTSRRVPYILYSVLFL